MNRQEEALRLAADLLEDIELQRLKVSEIVLKASRVARLVDHDQLLLFLRYERKGYPLDGSANDWISRADRWTDKNDYKLNPSPITRLEATLEGGRQALDALKSGGNYSGEYASIAAREHDAKIIGVTQQVNQVAAICGAVVSTVYSLVTEIYHELLFSELQATLFASVQGNVDGALAVASGSALDKIAKVSDRLREGDPESVSQAMTTCRRLIDSCADHLFTARDEPYSIGDGVELKVGQQNVLNRLQAYCHQQKLSKSRRDRLRKTLSVLYDRCSTGTHAEVDVAEARFVFLQTYVVLGEILTLANSAHVTS
ncbi:AbiTii domain-containing protein [Nocardia blacklockiae]|uniref:AbiTii domain-containing protein n=1 Tax=Nocardia blacklockiae TaxID=480036 RepID=UPI0018959148|nr:hypothetical protein [Nocardia blacklockiae]MBF6174396.1 hypothetical protein [Nocardia blacklockiae]